MSDPLLDVRIADAPPESPAVELPPLDEGPAGVRQLVEYLALRGLTGGLAALPASLLRPLEALLARALPTLDPRHAHGARDFLRTAFPEADPGEVEELLRAAYRHLIDVTLRADRLRARMVGHRIGDFFDLELCDEARELFEARGHGQGVLGLSAHLGWWELTGHVLIPCGLGPAYAIIKPPKNAFLTRYMLRSRARMGALCLPRHGAMRALPALLRAGATTQLLVDQRSVRGWVEAPFFGRPANCDRTFGVLARRVPKPILVYACLGTEDPERFRFVAPRVLDPAEFADLQPEECAARVNQHIESLIRMAPDQYFWLHDRFRGRDPLEPSSAAS